MSESRTFLLRRILASRRSTYVWIAIAIAVMLPSITTGFMMDDYLQKSLFQHKSLVPPAEGYAFNNMFNFLDGDVARNQTFIDMGALPWWTLPTIKQSFWRPIAGLCHQLDYILWPESPLLMHVHSLLWLALLLLCAAQLYRVTLSPPWVAGLATLIYVVDDAHAMPAGWIANRNELMATAFAILSLTHFVRWRETRQARSVVWSLFYFVIGLLTKESTIAITPYLFGYAIFVERGPLKYRLLTLLPYGIAVVVWRVVYASLGFGSYGMDLYVDPLSDPVQFAYAVVERLPLLLWSQWALPPSDIAMLIQGPALLLMWFVAVFGLALVIVLLLPLLRRDRASRFWAFGMLLALLPSCTTFPSDRMLLISGVGAMALMAALVKSATDRIADMRSKGITARASYTLIAAIVLVQVILPLPMAPIRVAGIVHFLDPAQSAANALPNDASVAESTVILVNAPVALHASYVPQIRWSNGLPVPKYTYTLAPDTQSQAPISITRTGDATLDVVPSLPYRFSLFRDAAHPFHTGDAIALKGVTIRIREISKIGEPTHVEYTFPNTLDASTMRWLRYSEGKYVSFKAPKVGETVNL